MLNTRKGNKKQQLTYLSYTYNLYVLILLTVVVILVVWKAHMHPTIIITHGGKHNAIISEYGYKLKIPMHMDKLRAKTLLSLSRFQDCHGFRASESAR